MDIFLRLLYYAKTQQAVSFFSLETLSKHPFFIASQREMYESTVEYEIYWRVISSKVPKNVQDKSIFQN